MPVLRSRQIPSSSSPSSPETVKLKPRSTPTAVEPPTPAKSSESVSQSPTTPPYRRRSRRLSGADAVGPTPKRSRNDVASESKEFHDSGGGGGGVRVSDNSLNSRVSDIRVLSLRSGTRVAKRVSFGGGNTRNCGGDDDVSVCGVEFDCLIGKDVDHVQELGQSEVFRVAKRLCIGGGDGNVGGFEGKEEIDGDLERSGSRKKTWMSTRRYSGEEKGKGKRTVSVDEDGLEEADLISLRGDDKDDVTSSKHFVSVMCGWGHLSIDDLGVVHSVDHDEADLSLRSPRRYTREEKGKAVLTSDDHGDDNDDDVLEKANLEHGLDDSGLDVHIDVEVDKGINLYGVGDDIEEVYRELRLKRLKEQHKHIAKRSAHKYAHFKLEDDEGQGRGEEDGEDFEGDADVPSLDRDVNAEEWPGPFSTAIRIIRDREKNLGKQAQKSSVKGGMPLISWTPKKERGSDLKKRSAPSLQNMCLKILAQNVDAISSLTYVPEVLRHKLCQMLCDSRRMNAHFFSLLLEGAPSEIRVADCSWLEEEEFERSIKACDTSSLTVLQLDLCGHCVSDVSLLKAVAPKGFPMLTTISLKGACRISDSGLNAIVSAAPVLRSMNLSQCSLLTDAGIKTIADKLGSIVHELYLDDCDTLDAMKILPSLKRLLQLEVLSLRGIGGVSDKFIRMLLTSNGQNMKELVLANCVNLTDASLKVIAEKCPQLCVLDLSYLRKLSDIGMVHLTNGCRGIQDLRLCRNAFSDDAIAAFLEASGESLKELSLNNVTKVGQNTTISLARRCKNLETLDLSWCRSLTDDALGLIADSCMSLRLLKIFGCTQITRTFIDGHSNPLLHVVGMKLTPILEHIKRPDFQQGPLYYSAVPSS